MNISDCAANCNEKNGPFAGASTRMGADDTSAAERVAGSGCSAIGRNGAAVRGHALGCSIGVTGFFRLLSRCGFFWLSLAESRRVLVRLWGCLDSEVPYYGNEVEL
jgi:hypothetical protein